MVEIPHKRHELTYASVYCGKVDPNSFNPLIELFPLAGRSIRDNYRSS